MRPCLSGSARTGFPVGAGGPLTAFAEGRNRPSSAQPRLSPLLTFKAHQDAEADHHGHHRRPAETDQRQRDADHRREAHDHHQIDRDIEEDRRAEARRAELAEAGRAALADLEAPTDDEGEGEDQEDPTEHAPFLGHGGEDEVGMAFGEVLEVALAALKEALAEYSA